MADNNVDISQISIEVEAEAGSALKNIDALSSTLSRLNANSKLTRTINNMDKLATSLSKFSGLNSSVNTVAKMSLALQKLSSVQKLSGLNSALNTLAKFPDVVKGLDATKLNAFSAAIAPLSASISALGDIQKLSGLNSAVNTLRKIPVVADELSKADFDQFAKDIERVRADISPLAAEMDKVSRGFSALPTNIQKAIAANQRLTTSNKNVANSYNVLGIGITKAQLGFGGMLLALRQVTQYLGASLANYNAYVENTNLFTVSMGRFADAGREATQTMQDVLGVDMSEGMRNMGVLQNLTTSFGVLDSQAYVLSKNLTQLGYDMASFFNIDTASAFEKLQAAISGELEPIRRLGVDISEARLQQELYNLGIDASVQSLSQADKALLRYIAIMDQTGNAQTDMARTLNSPANMIRVFQAQLELLSRSIGSLFIPMLNAVLPPLIAVTQILREAITAFASFLGINVDFSSSAGSIESSLGGVSSGVSDIGSSAAAAAKEIAYLIGGFDELNVLPSQSAGSGGGAGGATGGGILGDIELPEYDMFEGLVGSKVDEWVKKIKSLGDAFMDFIDPVLPLLESFGAGLLAAFATKHIVSFIQGLSNLRQSSLVIKAITGLMESFNTSFEAGEGVIKSTGNALKDFRNSLSTTAKLIIGAGGFVASFALAFTTIKDFTTGARSAEDALGLLAFGTAAIGTVMYVALGPVGLVITALGALAGAIAGNIVGVNELNREVLNNALFNSEGVPIEAVAEDVKQFNEYILTATESIRNNTAAFEANNDKVSEAGGTILELRGYMSLVSSDLSATYVPQIKEAFDNMATSIQSNMELIRLSLIGSLGNTPQEIINQLDADIPYLTDLILDATGNISEEASALQDRFAEVYAQWEANPSAELQQDLLDIATQMYGLSDEGGRAVDNFNDKVNNLGNVSFDSVDKVVTTLGDIGSSAQTTIEQIETTRTTMQDMLNELSAGMSAEDRMTLQKFFDESFTLQEEAVLAKQQEAVAMLSDAYSNVVSDSVDDAVPSIEDYMYILTDTMFGGMTADESVKMRARNRVSQDFQSVFDNAVNDAVGPVKELAKSLGLDAADGYALGITSNSKTAKNAASEMVEDSLSAVASAQRSNSPAKEYKLLGDYAAQGYAKGISGNSSLVTSSVQSMVNTALNSAKIPSQQLSQLGQQVPQQIANGIRFNIVQASAAMQSLSNEVIAVVSNMMFRLQQYAAQTIRINVQVNYSTRGSAPSGLSGFGRSVSQASIPMLADGGVLTKPRLVMAGEYPGASSNPEIVTPQNIMRDTVAEANTDMVIAIVSAIQALQQTIEDKDMNAYITEDEVGRSAAAYGRKQKRRTGRNPLTV